MYIHVRVLIYRLPDGISYPYRVKYTGDKTFRDGGISMLILVYIILLHIHIRHCTTKSKTDP